MAASTAGAIKAKVEAAGLGLAAFRDEAPASQALPYVTIDESISLQPELGFNPLDDAAGHVSEVVQVDLWQQWRDLATRAVTESYTLPGQLIRALHGVRLPASPKLVFECEVSHSIRMLERNDNLVHHAITVRIRRLM